MNEKKHAKLLQEIRDAGWNPWDEDVLGGNDDPPAGICLFGGLQILLITKGDKVLFVNAYDIRNDGEMERHIDWTGKVPTVDEIREFFDNE